MTDTETGAETDLDVDAAFARYRAIRPRLPAATFPAAWHSAPNLAQAAEGYGGLLLDAFGVLNVGETPIPGAVARMAELRARGKRLCVLTNAASYTRAGVLAKYHRLGFDFTADEVVSSRDVAAARLEGVAPGAHWGAIAAAGDSFADLPVRVGDALDDPALLDGADALLLLSTARWRPGLLDRIARALDRRPRPVVVANPDLVAPREGGLSLEPGLYGHALIDRLGVPVHWFGKPFGDAFTDALARMDLPAAEVAMVGDTPHTDILGGAAAGMGTILIADHGLLAGRPVAGFIAASGIVPDWVAATT